MTTEAVVNKDLGGYRELLLPKQLFEPAVGLVFLEMRQLCYVFPREVFRPRICILYESFCLPVCV
jgi:hypothetical protein